MDDPDFDLHQCMRKLHIDTEQLAKHLTVDELAVRKYVQTALLRCGVHYGLLLRDQEFLRHLVDIVWQTAKEDQSVPSTEWADRMIEKAKSTISPGPGLHRKESV